MTKWTLEGKKNPAVDEGRMKDPKRVRQREARSLTYSPGERQEALMGQKNGRIGRELTALIYGKIV